MTMRLSGTVIEIWRLKVHVHKQTHPHTHGTTDRTTNLLISSNVHYFHLSEIISVQIFSLSSQRLGGRPHNMSALGRRRFLVVLYCRMSDVVRRYG